MVSYYCDSSFQTKTQNLLSNEKAHLGDKRIKKMARGLLWLAPTRGSRLLPGARGHPAGGPVCGRP